MKKISAVLTCILIMISAFAPLCHAVDETDTAAADKIEYINILYELTVGEPVNDTEISISASTTSQPEQLNDMTDSFEIEKITWCKVEDVYDETLTEDSYYEFDEMATEFYLICTDEDLVDEATTYKVFITGIKSTDGMAYNLMGSGKIMINTTPIESINEGNTLYDESNLDVAFETRSTGPCPLEEVVTEPTTAETIPETVSETEPVVTEPATQKCSLCGICPFQPQGVCLFVWIAVIVAGIVVILILIKSLIKKDED